MLRYDKTTVYSSGIDNDIGFWIGLKIIFLKIDLRLERD
jgi:hypothetical protein